MMTEPGTGTTALGTTPAVGCSTRPTAQRWRRAATRSTAAGPPEVTMATSTRRNPVRRSASSIRPVGVDATTSTTVAPPARHTVTPATGSLRVGGTPRRNVTPGTAKAVAMSALPVHASNRRRGGSARSPSRSRRADRAAKTARPAARVAISIQWSSPRGRPAHDRATPSTQVIITRVGRWSTRATDPPNTPATRPAPTPHIITKPATGTASRLAGSETTGRPPNVVTNTGATPSWAAKVTAKASASGAGPGTARARGLLRVTMPSDAPTESRKPMESTRSGSTRTRPATASASNRSDDPCRPMAVAVMASAAITDARRTDGSPRVMTAKKAMTATVATH